MPFNLSRVQIGCCYGVSFISGNVYGRLHPDYDTNLISEIIRALDYSSEDYRRYMIKVLDIKKTGKVLIIHGKYLQILNLDDTSIPDWVYFIPVCTKLKSRIYKYLLEKDINIWWIVLLSVFKKPFSVFSFPRSSFIKCTYLFKDLVVYGQIGFKSRSIFGLILTKVLFRKCKPPFTPRSINEDFS